MPGNGTEMDMLHKMFGPDDHAPGTGTRDAGDKELSLIEVIKETEAERVDDSKVLESAEAGEAGARAGKKEKKLGFFSKAGKFLKRQMYTKPYAFWGRSKNGVILTLILTCLCLVGAVIGLSIVTVNGSKHVAQSSSGVSGRASLDVNGTPVVFHSGRRELRDGLLSVTTVTSSSDTSDACDNETSAVSAASESSVLSSVTIMANYNMSLTSTTTTLIETVTMPTSVDVLTKARPTVTPFTTASAMVPGVNMSVSTSSAAAMVPGVNMSVSILSASTLSLAGHCGETGDGAGPCARPYGHPNNTPGSWLSLLSAKSMGKASPTTPAGGVNATSFPMGIPAMASSVTDQSLPSPLGAATVLDAPDECASTATVYVTYTASEPVPATMTDLSASGTLYATSTSVELLTLTWTGSDGPMTTTETAFLGTAGTAATTTANVTVTLKATVGPSGTALSGSDPVPTGPVLTSGGEKQRPVPKPLGMGGSKSGNGVYCVVMLVALAALLT